VLLRHSNTNSDIESKGFPEPDDPRRRNVAKATAGGELYQLYPTTIKATSTLLDRAHGAGID
jgi:hypothetical protein